jgi:ABC-type dipeptide/oligopeptide/nickel transport system permease subunit
VETVEGEIGAPPFHPSSVFPWGTDHIGRDVQALVLAGTRQTLTLAFFGMLARLLAGVILGVLAGWWRGGWFDRLVTGAVGVWAAFPVTLFAMILIQAIGIQQGLWVFVVALCVVGWGEVAQFIRGQVIGIKPELYIEAARSLGARSTQILLRHVLPHLVAPMFVLGALEMGGILMLLAELGFLNLFLGGGFKVAIAEVGMMVPVIAYFSDVPEWGALLANIRDWWRSYNWLAWYPGLAFFLAIVAFNLWGEGLRRFLTESRISLGRLVNRYTLAAAAALLLVLGWTLHNTAPLGVYRPQAQQFDAERVLEDIRILASPDLEGRMTGTRGAERAAEFIAGQMQAAGLFPGGEDGAYVQALPVPRGYLVGLPRLEILDQQGHVAQALAYRKDFVEYAGSPTYSSAVGTGGAVATILSSSRTYVENAGAIVGLALGPHPEGPDARLVPGAMSAGPQDPYGLRNFDLFDRIVVVREAQAAWLNVAATGGALIVTGDPLTSKYLYRGTVWQAPSMQPMMVITPQVAGRLLATAGSSLADLERMGAGLPPGQIAMTNPGATVHLQAAVADDMDGQYFNVIGFVPGTGSFTASRQGAGMDSQAIIVSAYYDGLGVGPDGTLYPGANDNASGVAAMLEMARLLNHSPYQPKRTVVFIAWAGGERGEGLSLENVMGARPGFSLFTPEAVIELSGLGAGSGDSVALGGGSSFRLVRLYQDAAGRVGASTTTRGRGPHYRLYAPPGFGGRSALSLYVSWDGSDRTAHTPADAVEALDPDKLERVGQSTLLTLLVLSREVNY